MWTDEDRSEWFSSLHSVALWSTMSTFIKCGIYLRTLPPTASLSVSQIVNSFIYSWIIHFTYMQIIFTTWTCYFHSHQIMKVQWNWNWWTHIIYKLAFLLETNRKCLHWILTDILKLWNWKTNLLSWSKADGGMITETAKEIILQWSTHFIW